jgi:purine nucleoside permease
MSAQFDLSKGHWLLDGIAGISPEDGNRPFSGSGAVRHSCGFSVANSEQLRPAPPGTTAAENLASEKNEVYPAYLPSLEAAMQWGIGLWPNGRNMRHTWETRSMSRAQA